GFLFSLIPYPFSLFPFPFTLLFLEREEIRTNQELAGEEAVPGVFCYDTDRERIAGVGSAEEVLFIQVFAAQIGAPPLFQARETLFGKRLVDGSPPDTLLGRRFLDEILIFGRPACELTCLHHEGAVVSQRAFAAPDRMLHERGGLQIAIAGLYVGQFARF